MAGIDAALVSVTRRLNAAEGMDDTVDVFFAEFVNRILIRDWTKILSQNNPWRSRHHVTRAVREILGSKAAIEQAIGLSFRTYEGAEVAGVVHIVAHEHRERPNARFMIVTGVTTTDFVFPTEEGEMAKGFDQAIDGFRASGRKVEESDSASDYSTYLLNLLTYGSWHVDAHSYYKAVKRALVFQPVGDFTAFMRAHVLETEIIDIGRMRERLASHREIVRTIDSINRQITSLEVVVDHYSKAAEDDREARGRVVAAIEAAVGQRQSEIAAFEEKLAALRVQAETSEEAETAASDRKDEAGHHMPKWRGEPHRAPRSRRRHRLEALRRAIFARIRSNFRLPQMKGE